MNYRYHIKNCLCPSPKGISFNSDTSTFKSSLLCFIRLSITGYSLALKVVDAQKGVTRISITYFVLHCELKILCCRRGQTLHGYWTVYFCTHSVERHILNPLILSRIRGSHNLTTSFFVFRFFLFLKKPLPPIFTP